MNTMASVQSLDSAADLMVEIERLRALCAEMYQVAGVLDADERVLDNLSAAAQGQPLPHASLLPYSREQE